MRGQHALAASVRRHRLLIGLRAALLSAPLFATALAAPPAGGGTQANNRDVAGLVDIGDGRRIYLECRGTGSPEVILISGKGNDAADWSEILDPADPVRAARHDLLLAGQGRLLKSASAVFPSVAQFTRVCAYDRPGTRIAGNNTSTPVVQPHPLSQDVRDLSRLLTAAHEAGPYVLVANSYGGLIALLYARTHAGEIAGLVMVDGATERMKQVLGPAKLARWDASSRVSSPESPEAVELADAFETIRAAPPVPGCPAVVLSAGKPWPPAPPDAMGDARDDTSPTFADWQAAQDLLAASLNARHVTVATSGHSIYLYEPQLVANAIRDTVNEARRNAVAAPRPR